MTFLSRRGLTYHVNTFHQNTHQVPSCANHPQSVHSTLLPNEIEFDIPPPHLDNSLPNTPPEESPLPPAGIQAHKGVKMYHPILNGVQLRNRFENKTTD
jgi:hypothetical protein